jgi:hypothetical protein
MIMRIEAAAGRHARQVYSAGTTKAPRQSPRRFALGLRLAED